MMIHDDIFLVTWIKLDKKCIHVRYVIGVDFTDLGLYAVCQRQCNTSQVEVLKK